MKNLVTFFLLCLGIAGYDACSADTPPPDGKVYQATIASSGVQHVRIEGGGYFFKPDRVIVKVYEIRDPIRLNAKRR